MAAPDELPGSAEAGGGAAGDQPVDQSSGTAEPPEARTTPGAVPPPPESGAVPMTRTATTWAIVAGALIVLVLVLVFILQNLHDTTTHFFSATWTVPLGIDLLLAAVLGGLVVAFVGTLRILQLRRLAHRRGRRRAVHP
jgi:uncharacterized integral membrane protein